MDNEKNQIPENDEDLIELIDENGESSFFEHLATFEYKGESYLAVCDPETDEEVEDEESELEVFILKIETDEDGNDVYTVLEDDKADEVFDYFVTLVDDTTDQ